MKKFTHLRLLLALLVCFSAAKTHAALLLEPVAGYSVGKFNIEYDSPIGSDSEDYSMKGISYGGRIGYQNLGFQLGVDYLASNLDDGDDTTLKTSEWAGFVGFEFPILVRVYAAYVFSGTGDADVENNSFDLEGASGPKLGVGFTVLPFLDVNLEYRRITYDTHDIGAGIDLNSDYSATMLSVSLPFTL